MPSIEQLKNALVAAHEAGDTEAAQVFASDIKAMQAAPVRPLAGQPLSPTTQATIPQIQEELATRAMEQPEEKPEGYLSALGTGFKTGAAQIGQGAMERMLELAIKTNQRQSESLIDDYLSGKTEPSEENLKRIIKSQELGERYQRTLALGKGKFESTMEKARPSLEEYPVTTAVGQAVGQAAALPIPAIGASVPGRIAGSALSGAISGALQPAQEGDSVLNNALVGAGVGGGIGAVTEAALPFVKRYINLKKGEFASDDIADMVAQAKKEGIDVFAPDVSKSPFLVKASTLAEEIPIIGPASNRLAQNEQQREAARRLASEFGDNIDDIEAAVQGSLKRKLDVFRETAGQKFTAAGQVLDQLGDVPTTNMDKAIQSALDAELKKGSIGKKEIIEKLQNYVDAPRGGFSQIRDLRQALGDDISDFYGGADKIIGKRGVGALQSVKSALESDLDNFAEKSGSEEGLRAYRAANNYYRTNVIPFKKGVLADLVKTDEPEKIVRYLTQHKTSGGVKSRANKLYEALDDDGREAVRSALIRDVLAKSDSDKTFSPAKFAKGIDDISNITGVFFTQADKKRIDGLGRIMEYTKRAGQVSENPPTGARLLLPGGIAALGGAAAGGASTALATTGSIGAYGAAFKALYNTKTGRDLLIAASHASPGSKGFEAIANKANSLVTKAVVADETKKEAPARINKLNKSITEKTMSPFYQD